MDDLKYYFSDIEKVTLDTDISNIKLLCKYCENDTFFSKGFSYSGARARAKCKACGKINYFVHLKDQKIQKEYV